MIKVTRINIPCPVGGYDGDKKMEAVLAEKLAEVGLTIQDISIPESALISPHENNASHFGNWVFVFAVDSPQLRKANLVFDMDQYLLEAQDIEALKVGDKVSYQFTNFLAGQSTGTGTVAGIRRGEMWDKPFLEVSILKARSRTKGHRFYAGEFVKITKA